MAELSNIKDEDLLRKLWQETEDFGRKKEIRAHMYKLREARLKDFYVHEMDSKTPITTRHGDSMADHSFESLKSNEIHGTDVPMRDIKFGPITDGTGGWNVISSSETSNDGKARTEKMLATTEGVKAVDGGKKVFSGKNEELKTERYDGDANNFTYSTGESSNMMLNENIVTGDDNNKRTEKKSSSVSHSSTVTRKSTNTGDSTGFDDDFQNLSTRDHELKSSVNERNSSTHSDHQRNSSDVRHSTQSRNENVDVSQESDTVKEAFRLAQQPGNIISRKVEKANPTTNMITEKKELADGTIVTTKRYETISSDHVDIQATTRDNRSNVKTHEVKKTSENVNQTHETNKASQNVNQTQTSKNVNQTFKTARDEEAFRLSQQPGTVISRNVEMSDPTTRMITEKKELTDGTIVTTKRFEKITSSEDHTSNVNSGNNVTREHFVDTQSTKSFKNDAKTTSNTSDDVRRTSTNETFKTSRDEEAFRLSQLPGKVISRDVQMTNPTTRLITEKKELNDGTIVTTKRYESTSSDTQSNKNITKEHNVDVHSKNLRSDSTTSNQNTRNVNQTFKTARDEEAFRLSEQPGTVISRNVEMTNPTTRMITEKKELTDGTIVTTKRYETVENVSKNFSNVDSQNVRKIVANSNTDARKSTFDNSNDREVVEEMVTKKIFDTSCHCPEAMHDHKTKQFINQERNDDRYDITSEIITDVHDRTQSVKKDLAQSERIREENIRREEIRKLEQKRVDEQMRHESTRKFTRELEVDSAHKAFASSLRCVTPPNERVSTPHIPRNENRSYRSPSRETTTSKISSSTTTIRKSSQSDLHKNEVRRSSTKSSSPEKSPKKVTPDSRRSTTEVVETFDSTSKAKRPSASPQKVMQSSPSKVHPQKAPEKSSPKKAFPDSRDSSPNKPSTPRDISPTKPSTFSSPKDNSPTISYPSSTPRETSPGKFHPRDNLPTKPSTFTTTRDVSPTKPRDNSPTKSYPSSTPRETSPRDNLTTKPSTFTTTRDVSPTKPRDNSPTKSYPSSTPRETYPEKSYPRSGSNTPREVSPHKYPSSNNTSRDASPNKHTDSKTTKRENELFSSTVILDNKQKSYRDDLKILQTVDTKNMSATTSVSDLEYIPATRRPLITDLDSDFEIKIDVSNFDTADDLKITTTVSEINDVKKSSKKPEEKRPEYKRSETFEERARKLIGVTSDNETKDENVPSYAKPTYASLPNANRVSEIRERKAKIEEIENSTITKRKSLTCETEDFITHEKNESRRRSTQAFSSPDQSPTRSTAKKPNEQRPNEYETTMKINGTKTSKTTETRHTVPEKKKPETNKKINSEQPTRRPETHISEAKIHITPTKNVTSKTTTKTTVTETNKNLKVAPSIRLVKRPTTDVSSTEPDSDFDTDHDLIRNIDKSTSKSTRKKLLQSRKDSAPVPKTTSTSDREKTTRSVTENLFKSDKSSTIDRSTTRRTTTVQPRETSPKKDTKRPTKCVTTKTINLKNVNTINSNTLDDVVIDVVQAKSSREPSPNKVVPTPVRPDEVINGNEIIYPDKVTEPDDVRRQKPKVKNIPIFQEKTNQFIGIEITEVETAKSPIILEEDEIDEHERIVINSSTLERADRKRNSVQIDPLSDGDEEDHAHLLSVSQKVNKFMETAEELKKPKTSSPFNVDNVRLEDVSEPEDDSMLTVNRKVTKFSTTNDESSTYERKQRERTNTSMTRSVDEVDENLENDECLLSVSDKVNKFISSAEKLKSSAPQKSPELVKNIMKTSTKSTRKNEEDVNESFLTKEKVSMLTRDDHSESKTTARSTCSDITLKSTEAIKKARAAFDSNTAERDTKRHDDILSRPSVWEAKQTTTTERKVYKEPVTRKSPTEKSPSRERQSQSPTNERKVFKEPVTRKSPTEKSPSRERQSQSPTNERKVFKEPVTRKSPTDGSPSREKQSQSPHYESKSPSPSSPRREPTDRSTPVYMRDQVSTKKDLFEKRISSSKLETEMSHQKSLSPQTSVDERNRSESEEVHHSITRRTSSDKHYMSHTVSSLEHVANERREHELNRTSRSGSRRDSGSKSPSKFHRNISESTNEETFESPRSPIKFGVELKRTDSRQSRRRSSTNVETICIEEIFDLAELEKLLEVVVGYEQRRRIRAQIRLVKKKISDEKTTLEARTTRTTTSTTSSSSPSRKPRELVTNRKTIVEKPEKLSKDDSRVQKVVTTTTTTTTRQSSDKPREVTQTRTTRVTNEKAPTSSPRNIIENLNKNSKVKTSENVVKIVKKNSATSNTQKSRDSKIDTTDCVTSSYGVGPTDSNGLPLFGLKALKKKVPTTSTTTSSKTTGTVVSEVSYSENGKPATVERKTTKYSTDPSDFTHEIDSDYKTSTSERKSSRGGVYSVTKIEKLQDDSKSNIKTTTTPSSRIIRRGSVKELKDKFVRKDSSSKVTENSSRTDTKRSSVNYHDSESESESYSVSKQYKSSSTKESKSFLNSEKKASNVQEVLSYMRNADHVQEEGDSKEDVEARALLNKFLGATALMTGIENNSGLSKEFLSTGSSTSKNQRASPSSKVTKTVTSYSTGKAYDINDIWDVDLLKKLLDSTTNYDDRRKIRARLRQVMADKEVGDGSVKQLAPELDAESVAVVEKKEEGESLLLPLIQGILQNPKYQNLSARQLFSLNLSKTIAQTGATSSKMNNELNATDQLGNDCLPIEDSGTESGEDLRLLAAGLQSNLSGMEVNNESNDIEGQSPQNKGKNDALAAGLLLEVTTALARLQNSINQGEIELEESKKTALLSLVNRLQQGLVSPEKIPENIETESPVAPVSESPQEGNSERRGSAGINRFAKRRNRTNRHTVGVTREELADARRIIEELEFIGIQNSSQNLENLVHKPKAPTTVIKPFVPFSRQISEPVTLLRPSQFVPKDTIKQIEIPNRNFKSKVLFKQSISLDQPISILKNNQETSPKIEDKPTIFKKFTIQRNSSGSNNKFPVNNHKDEAPTDESSSSDDDDEMVNTKFYNNNTASKFKAKENYLRNQQPVERSLNYSSGDETSTPGTRQPKYVSKKMKMKRANTVDLPKSYSFVNTFDLSDKDCSDSESRRSVYQSRPSNAGLRTTITGGSPSNLPPQFTPKTENDKKFLAFIQKQNSSVTPSYVNPCDKNSTKTHNWTNKFGHLKNRFEGDEPQMPSKPPAKASNQAATFWKGIEKEKPSAKVSPLPPVQPFMKELPLVSEKFPWKSNLTEKIFKTDEQIVLKKKPMIEKFVPKEIKAAPEPPRVFSEPNKLPILKPSNVNNFSHAPMSAFKPPISRKLSNSFKPIHTTEEIIKKPLPQVSNGIVKQMAETSYNGHSNNQVPQPRKIILSSPTRSIGDSTMVKITKYSEKPEAKQPVAWAGKQKSERVLSLAASKFENVPTVNMAVNLHNLPPVDPPVKYRTNPLYNGTFEKRSSLPPNASYATFDSSLYSKQGQSVSNVNAVPKEATFTITDFTQPISVSTYALPEQTSKRPTYDRQESLTNPELEPLVLTATRTVFSPNDKPKPMELYDIPTPNSSQFSKDHSIGSMCDDIENEIADIGVECNVAVSKVMKGPVAQMAYTQCSELTSLNGQEKENSMIKNLSDSLKKLSQKSPTPEKRQVDVKRLSHDSSNSSLDFKVSSPFKISSNSEVHLSKDSSNSSIDSSKLPPLKIPIPAVPETSYSITYSSPPKIQVKSPSVDPPHHVLYNKIAPNVQSTPHHNQGLQRARSSHMLEIPRPTDPAVPPQAMYGASQSMVAAKQKTVQSYFGPKRAESLSMKSATSYVRPVTFNSPTQPSTIARKISLYSKPVQKVAHQAPLYSLARSRTLPSMANVDLLDESNIDDAFEELLSSTNL